VCFVLLCGYIFFFHFLPPPRLRLDQVVDEAQFFDDGFGDDEGVEVREAHAAIDGIQREGQRQPIVHHAVEIAMC